MEEGRKTKGKGVMRGVQVSSGLEEGLIALLGGTRV